MSTRIIICRHGNTFDKGDIVTRVGARTDLPLSQSGKAQAEKLKQYFHPKHSIYKFERAFCSELIRTRETALKILEDLHPAKLLEESFLKEIDYGRDENRPESEVLARIGQEAMTEWDTAAIVPDGWQIDPDQIRAEWRAFLQEMSKTPGDVLVMTSNGIARFCLDVVDDIACEVPSIKLATAGFGIVNCAAGKTTMTDWNVKIGLKKTYQRFPKNKAY